MPGSKSSYDKLTRGNGPVNSPASKKTLIDSPMVDLIATSPFKSGRTSSSPTPKSPVVKKKKGK